MPASLVATAALRLQFGSCRSSAGAISCAAIVRARSAQVPGMFFVRRAIDSTSEPPSRAFFAESRICASALSIRNAGGTSPAARAACMRPSSPSSCFAYDCSRARYASASAAFSMR